MPEPIPRKLPLPRVQLFVACNEIFHDQRTGQAILVGPFNHVPLKQFPAHVRLSFFAELLGVHGHYQPRLVLRDDADEVVSGWSGANPIDYDNPLFPHQVTFFDLKMAVPRVGRHSLAYLLNGEEVAQRGLWFGPAEAIES
jgi:hypothetical protein